MIWSEEAAYVLAMQCVCHLQAQLLCEFVPSTGVMWSLCIWHSYIAAIPMQSLANHGAASIRPHMWRSDHPRHLFLSVCAVHNDICKVQDGLDACGVAQGFPLGFEVQTNLQVIGWLSNSLVNAILCLFLHCKCSLAIMML